MANYRVVLLLLAVVLLVQSTTTATKTTDSYIQFHVKAAFKKLLPQKNNEELETKTTTTTTTTKLSSPPRPTNIKNRKILLKEFLNIFLQKKSTLKVKTFKTATSPTTQFTAPTTNTPKLSINLTENSTKLHNTPTTVSMIFKTSKVIKKTATTKISLVPTTTGTPILKTTTAAIVSSILGVFDFTKYLKKPSMKLLNLLFEKFIKKLTVIKILTLNRNSSFSFTTNTNTVLATSTAKIKTYTSVNVAVVEVASTFDKVILNTSSITTSKHAFSNRSVTRRPETLSSEIMIEKLCN